MSSRDDVGDGEGRARAKDNTVREIENAWVEELKLKWKILRGKITHSVNRIYTCMEECRLAKSRADKELNILRKEFADACDVNAEMFALPDADCHKLEKWETELVESFYDFDDFEVRTYPILVSLRVMNVYLWLWM